MCSATLSPLHVKRGCNASVLAPLPEIILKLTVYIRATWAHDTFCFLVSSALSSFDDLLIIQLFHDASERKN
jgi:hypothetical protein